MKEIFKQSENYKEEYSCRVARIGTVYPIENSDFLGKTYIGADQLVVRKDQVKEGDYFFYVTRECVLPTRFLFANNLYRFERFQMNSNADEVQKLVDESKTLSGKELDAKLAEARSKCGYFAEKNRVRITKLRGVASSGFIFSVAEMLKYKPELEEVFKNHELSDFEGTFFDTVGDELFCKAYVPKIKKRRNKPRRKTRVERRVEKYLGWLPEKYQRKIIRKFQKPKRKLSKKEKRLLNLRYFLPEHFEWHYDTSQFGNNLFKFKPNQVVDISVKIHGTSAIYANVLRQYPYTNIPYWCKRVNRVVDALHLPKKLKYPETYEAYGYIYSTRNKIQEKTINPSASCWMGRDPYTKYHELFKKLDCIEPGMTVYGEIFGYNPDSNIPIQGKQNEPFAYGCEVGKSKFMPYRITTELSEGGKFEWNVSEVMEWTERLVKLHPELADDIELLHRVYHGRLSDLYPELDTANHWHEELLLKLKNDKNFHMEENEPLCTTAKLPREGICIRIENDPNPEPECFKLKCDKFYEYEAKLTDSGIVDADMAEGYSDEDTDSDSESEENVTE